MFRIEEAKLKTKTEDLNNLIIVLKFKNQENMKRGIRAKSRMISIHCQYHGPWFTGSFRVITSSSNYAIILNDFLVN